MFGGLPIGETLATGAEVAGIGLVAGAEGMIGNEIEHITDDAKDTLREKG